MEPRRTLSSSWKNSLRSWLENQQPRDNSLRLAVVGIGSPLNGDDGAGPALAQALQPWAAGFPFILVLDAGPAPENFTGSLRRFAPDLVLLVDAALMDGAQPGDIRLLDWKEAGGFQAGTHTLPLSIFAGYLSSELDCQVALLGIQPAANAFDTPLSPQVSAAVESIASTFEQLILPTNR